MDIYLYLAFLIATAVLVAIPGPTVLLVTSVAIRHGMRAGLMAVAGGTSAAAVYVAIIVAGGVLGAATACRVPNDDVPRPSTSVPSEATNALLRFTVRVGSGVGGGGLQIKVASHNGGGASVPEGPGIEIDPSGWRFVHVPHPN